MTWLNDATITTAEDKAAQAREAERQRLKSEVEAALSSLTHTFADGRVVQVRKSDLPNFEAAIQIGESEEWIMADNTTSVLTVEEMTEALQSGIAQGKALLRDYVAAVGAL